MVLVFRQQMAVHGQRVTNIWQKWQKERNLSANIYFFCNQVPSVYIYTFSLKNVVLRTGFYSMTVVYRAIIYSLLYSTFSIYSVYRVMNIWRVVFS